ncbi:motility associated factor glycosyltransferase family protein [Paenibacillus cucumis Kampfer et al. 2016]|uniref:Motility associated factor glycosyltransferase family protein n=2 Tax=Paenibacillus cucumis (ex Kampfer et al. 2016) TaxID=1776858 RepID=A0ABS7KPE2_9BACL|nr:motility associated factor glycosyltransferase family protein [Paenibacillus cucumis (ex Kampfer et al. 2016)]
MDFLNHNIEILSANPDHWIGAPDENEIDQSYIEVDREGNEIFFDGSRVFTLRSDFDASNQPNPLKRELIFVVGIQSVEEIKKVIAMKGTESLLVIIEPNGSLFNYSLQHKDLSFLHTTTGAVLFTDKISNLPLFLDKFLLTNAIFYVKTIKFYFTHFYREQEIQSSVAVVRAIKEIVNYKTMMYGNSVEDSLIGFRHNMKNLKHLTRSKNVSLLKNTMRNVPAVVVAAGPSLNKNIEQLHSIKDNAVIIAVDTIAQRLCNEGIIPDFICSIEREVETYTYFYDGKTYPVESTLVGPLVLYPEIFEEYHGQLVIPMREGVGEYIWLKDVLELEGDNSISIGLSCAHVAFGVAEHIGASPIILLGQDLAYGNSVGETHAGGTIYDDKKLTNSMFSAKVNLETEGYYGGLVTTTETWNTFRTWFEMEIATKGLTVINATEGGSKISHTQQLSLAEVGQEFCKTKITPVLEVLQAIENYPLDKKKMKQVMREQYRYFYDIKLQFEKQQKQVRRLDISEYSSETELKGALKKIDQTEDFFKLVMDNWLLRHCLQPAMINSVWNLYTIERVNTADNIILAQKANLGFLDIGVYALNEITNLLAETAESLDE